MPPRRSDVRRHLTIQQKVLIIEKREREGLKQGELAKWAAAEFGLASVPTQPTICHILKDKDRLREALRLNPQRAIKTVRDVTCSQFEDAVVQWIHATTATATRPIERRAVLEFASTIQSEYPRAKDLALSEGWLSRLMERRTISLRPANERQPGQDEDSVVETETPSSPPARSASSPRASTTREILPTPQRTHVSPGQAPAASPSWSDIASPVFTSTPVRMHSRLSARSSSTGSQPLAPTASPHPFSPQRLDATKVYDQVCEYYGTHLKTTHELRTTRSVAEPPKLIREILSAIPETVAAQSYGCGLPLPLGIDGLHVLDLGCGSGRDAYVLSALVGLHGSVTGVDMTPPLLNVAKHNVAAFTERLKMSRSSLHFVHGYMEYLDQAGIEHESMDIVVANAAVNLTPDKKRTLHEVFRVLRTGGEFQFSEIYASRRVPDHVRDDAVLYCEGLGSAMYVDDMRAQCRDAGFGEPRELSSTPLVIKDEALAACVRTIEFTCTTFRCFKVPGMELRATEEDYGHVAKYLGTIPGHEAVYVLNVNYRFEARRPVRIGGNTAAILTGSWLARHFEVIGDYSEHFGRFT